MPRCPSCHRRIAEGSRCARDGWPAPAPPDEAATAPPAVAGCAVGRRLGGGGHAEVWEAHRLAARAAAALKVGRSDHAPLVARFGREAEALLRVGPPHAPPLHACGTLADGRPYLLMDLAPGATLARWLEAREAPPPPERAVALALAVARAVEGVHARGLAHRDLKPDNVLVDEAAGTAVLIDFGLARGAGAGEALAQVTRAGTAAGTLEYVAPEQLRGDPAQDGRADVYSLGVMLYELLTLRPPFVGDAAEVEYGHAALRPPRPGEITAVPEAIERIVLACLAKDPAHRPQSVFELRRALEEALSTAAAGAAGRTGEAGGGGRAAMIGDGRRPAVVLLVETAAPASAVLAAVGARRGMLARQRGRRYVALFSASEMDAPIEAAAGAADELCAGGGRAALHLAHVTIRTRADGSAAVNGAAVDRPESWLPAGAWSGVVRTAEIERAAAATGTGTAPRAETPLLGRDAALAALDRSAAVALGGRPALVTVLGDHGLGKSRVAAEAAARFRRSAGPGAVIALRATQPAAGDVERTSAELLARLRGPGGEAPAHRVDRARAIAAAIERRAREAPLAIVLDDAHWADDATLDALELSTLQGPGALWVVVAAHPRLEEARRGWGGRAERHDRVALEPLDEAAGRELAAALLAPAEYPPADALARLHAWAAGNPACLAEIAGALKEAGLVRRRGASGAHYLETSEIRALPASPAWQWLAARALDAMPPELAALARLCAVLGAGLSREEVEAVQEALDRAGAPSTPIDAGVGLRALRERGVLAPIGGERLSFRSAVLEEAVLAMLDAAHRDRIRRAALALWRARVEGAGGEADTFALERLARHAAAAGEREEAARVRLSLGDRERARHRLVAADAHYTAALEQLGEGGGEGPGAAAARGAAPERPGGESAEAARAQLAGGGEEQDTERARQRARALAGRGKVRYRLYRTVDSLADFAAARALAEAAGDGALVADALLEEATALDWESDFAASTARVEAARPLVERLGDAALALRLRVAEGRSAWRHGRVDEAVELLGRGASEAEAAGDYEARVVALSLLSCALVVAGRLDEAEARCDEVIALAGEARDGVHLSVAYTNRFFLWSQRKDLVRAAADMRRAMELAREAGNPWPERAATINLAELLFWCGRDDESLALAERGRALEERFSSRPVHEGTLVLARVRAARGDRAEAAALAAWVEESCPPDASASAHSLLTGVRLLVTGAPPEAWDALMAEAGALVPVERLELLYHRARAAAEAGRREELSRVRAEAESLFDESPDFRRRFAELDAVRPDC